MQLDTWEAVAEHSGKVWSVAGPLAGVLIGAWLTGRRQKREWLTDNKKEEYRELVAAITKSLSDYVQIYAVQVVRSGGDERTIRAVDSNFAEVVSSRLFIAETLKGLDVARRFLKIKTDFRKNSVVELLISDTDKLIDEILRAASKDLSAS